MYKRAQKQVQTVAALVPTYRRPDALIRCLAALARQEHKLHEVLVVVREDDVETLQVLARRGSGDPPIRTVVVNRPGAIAARNAALDVCQSDIVAMIDDDTAPYVDWSSRILENFRSDPSLGGLGGRDRCFGNGQFDDRQEAVVGKIQWFGNVIGNHHLGFGAIREVDALKGANMSYRLEAAENIRFDSRLKGQGAQPGEDVCFAVAVKCDGWKLAYDPTVLVDHFPAQRSDQRFYAEVSAVQNTRGYWEFCYNQILMIWGALPAWRRVVFFFWTVLVGNRNFPGLVQAIRFTPSLGVESWRRFIIAQRAKLRAFADLMLSPERRSPGSV